MGHSGADVFLDEVTFVGDWEKAVKFLLDSPLSSLTALQVTGSTCLVNRIFWCDGTLLQLYHINIKLSEVFVGFLSIPC